ncbi:MAG: hypothetical protein Fur002_18310 [Anaerolineales bacterium]
MRKWFLILWFAALMAFPAFAAAQSTLTLNTVKVDLWPEYDQPSMLVLIDFEAPASATLPADFDFRIPKDANVVAAAYYGVDGSLLTAPSSTRAAGAEWQTFTITLQTARGHFEYYQPLSVSGQQRTFSYLWDEPYAVNAFQVNVLEPLDVTSLTTTPNLSALGQKDGLNLYSGAPQKVAAGEQFTLILEYQKTTDSLVTTASQSVQPADPLNENTPGRASFTTWMPYIIGALGLILILGGGVYYWQASKGSGKSPARKRARAASDGEDVYCPQCGSRAKSGDRFCRTCGARLRQAE